MVLSVLSLPSSPSRSLHSSRHRPSPNPNPISNLSPAFSRSKISSPTLKSPHLLRRSAAPERPPPSADDDGAEDEEEIGISEFDSQAGIEIEVLKVGRNRRRIEARVGVDAELDTVWGVLTDYEGLAGFIPSLAVCELLEKGENFAKIYQVGQQELALGLKFNAKGILDCYEKKLELFPAGRRRDIEFKMIEGDFQTFEGIWSIMQNKNESIQDAHLEQQHFQTSLSYIVELEPKLWLPVRLLEGRLCREIKINLYSVRDEAQRIQRGKNNLSTCKKKMEHARQQGGDL